MHQTTRFLGILAAAASCAITMGCAVPHNNTLVFAVNRKVGIDITPTNPTSAGVTIGFSASEFAWVPLWANGPDGTPFEECKNETKAENEIKAGNTAKLHCAKHPKFLARDAEGKGNGKDEDAYSVFASFGGTATANAGSENKADLKIASFFATGIAAQNLAEADPQKLVGADIRSSNSGTLRGSLRAYFDTVAANEKVSTACVDALKLDKTKFPTIGKDLNDFRSEYAASFVARQVAEKTPDQSSNIKYQAEFLRAKFQSEKAEAIAKSSKTPENEARGKVCA